MGLQCLNCGNAMVATKNISLYVGSKKGLLGLVENDGHKVYIPCLSCNNRNYLIKEYGPVGAFFRLSHSEYHAAATVDSLPTLK